eukprot:746876-Hanusia_phi.AAC.2
MTLHLLQSLSLAYSFDVISSPTSSELPSFSLFIAPRATVSFCSNMDNDRTTSLFPTGVARLPTMLVFPRQNSPSLKVAARGSRNGYPYPLDKNRHPTLSAHWKMFTHGRQLLLRSGVVRLTPTQKSKEHFADSKSPSTWVRMWTWRGQPAGLQVEEAPGPVILRVRGESSEATLKISTTNVIEQGQEGLRYDSEHLGFQEVLVHEIDGENVYEWTEERLQAVFTGKYQPNETKIPDEATNQNILPRTDQSFILVVSEVDELSFEQHPMYLKGFRKLAVSSQTLQSFCMFERKHGMFRIFATNEVNGELHNKLVYEINGRSVKDMNLSQVRDLFAECHDELVLKLKSATVKGLMDLFVNRVSLMAKRMSTTRLDRTVANVKRQAANPEPVMEEKKYGKQVEGVVQHSCIRVGSEVAPFAVNVHTSENTLDGDLQNMESMPENAEDDSCCTFEIHLKEEEDSLQVLTSRQADGSLLIADITESVRPCSSRNRQELRVSLTVDDRSVRPCTPEEISQLLQDSISKKKFTIRIRRPKDLVFLKDFDSFLVQGTLYLQRQSLHEVVWRESQIFLKENVLYYYKSRFDFEIEKDRQQFYLEGCRAVAVDDDSLARGVDRPHDLQGVELRQSTLEVLAKVKENDPSCVHIVAGNEGQKYVFKIINLLRGGILVFAAHSQAERDFWVKEITKRADIVSKDGSKFSSLSQDQMVESISKDRADMLPMGEVVEDKEMERNHILERIKVLKHSVPPRDARILKEIEMQVNDRSNLDVAMEVGLTPAGGCCYVNDVGLLGMLLDFSVNPNAKDANGMAPLSVACGEGHIECVELLLARRADVRGNSEASEFSALPLGLKTPIFRAVQGGNAACVQAILKEGGNPNEIGGGGVTPVFLAMEQGMYDCLQLLIECNADVNRRRIWDGADALEAAIETAVKRVTRMRVMSMGTTTDSVPETRIDLR